MKRSNLFIMLLIFSYCVAVFGTNKSLVRSYHSVQLEDPFKNYDDYPVAAFTSLRLKGGNSFAVKLSYGKTYTMKVMKSRKEFFKYSQLGDSLAIEFTVPKTTSQQVPTGVIITCPDLKLLVSLGVRVKMDSLNANALSITQEANAGLEISNTKIHQLLVETRDQSWINFTGTNKGQQLQIRAFNRTRINIHEIDYSDVKTDFRDSSYLSLSASSVKKLVR